MKRLCLFFLSGFLLNLMGLSPLTYATKGEPARVAPHGASSSSVTSKSKVIISEHLLRAVIAYEKPVILSRILKKDLEIAQKKLNKLKAELGTVRTKESFDTQYRMTREQLRAELAQVEEKYRKDFDAIINERKVNLVKVRRLSRQQGELSALVKNQSPTETWLQNLKEQEEAENRLRAEIKKLKEEKIKYEEAITKDKESIVQLEEQLQDLKSTYEQKQAESRRRFNDQWTELDTSKTSAEDRVIVSEELLDKINLMIEKNEKEYKERFEGQTKQDIGSTVTAVELSDVEDETDADFDAESTSSGQSAMSPPLPDNATENTHTFPEAAADRERLIVDVGELMPTGFSTLGTYANLFSLGMYEKLMRRSTVGVQTIHFGDNIVPLEQQWYAAKHDPYLSYSAPFDVWVKGSRFNGFIEQGFSVVDNELKEMTYRMYLVPGSAGEKERLHIRKKHEQLQFTFRMNAEKQMPIDGPRYMPFTVRALDLEGVHQQDYRFKLMNKEVAFDLAEDAKEVPRRPGTREPDDKNQRFLFRAYHPNMTEMKYQGVYPVPDLDAFKDILTQYAALESGEKINFVSALPSNNLIVDFKNPAFADTGPFYWLARYENGYFIVEPDDTSEIVSRPQPQQKGTGLVWNYLSTE